MILGVIPVIPVIPGNRDTVLTVRFGSAARTQNFEREVFFYYFSNFPLFLFVKRQYPVLLPAGNKVFLQFVFSLTCFKNVN